MKICFITHYSEFYGANKSLIDAVNLLISHHHVKREDILIISPNTGALTEKLKTFGIPYFISYFEADLYKPKSLKAILATKRRIKKRTIEKEAIIQIIRELEPDIIHSNSSVFTVGAVAAKELNIPHIWHVREDIENHYKRKYDNPTDTYKLMRKATNVIATSNYISQLLEKKNIKSRVLYNVIDHKVLTTNKSKNSSSIFGVVGLVHERKNQRFIATTLIPFLKEHKNAFLIFYGSGNQKIIESILNISNSHPEIKDQIILKGYTSKLDDIYSTMDVLINMSENEAFGRVNLEAYSYGIPVIGLKSGATSELILNNSTGILIEKSVNQLKHACIRLASKKTRNSMGVNALNYFNEINNPERYALDLMSIYRNVSTSNKQ